MSIGKSKEQHVISRSTVLGEEGTQAEHVDAGEIIELIGALSSYVDLFALEVKTEANS